MPGYAKRTISPNILWQRACSKYTPFLINMREKSAWKLFMDGLLKNKITEKRGKILFTYGVHCINKPTSKRYICMLQM